MSNLRNQLIRLAHERPETRPHLLPLLGTSTREAGGHDVAQDLMDLADTLGSIRSRANAGHPLPPLAENSLNQALATFDPERWRSVHLDIKEAIFLVTEHKRLNKAQVTQRQQLAQRFDEIERKLRDEARSH
jgi:hypothetical protein